MLSKYVMFDTIKQKYYNGYGHWENNEAWSISTNTAIARLYERVYIKKTIPIVNELNDWGNVIVLQLVDDMPDFTSAVLFSNWGGGEKDNNVHIIYYPSTGKYLGLSPCAGLGFVEFNVSPLYHFHIGCIDDVEAGRGAFWGHRLEYLKGGVWVPIKNGVIDYDGCFPVVVTA